MFSFWSYVVLFLSLILTVIIFKTIFSKSIFFSFAAKARYIFITWVVVFLILLFIFNKVGLIKTDSSEKKEVAKTTVTQAPSSSLAEEDNHEYSYQEEEEDSRKEFYDKDSQEESYDEILEEVDELYNLPREELNENTESDENTGEDDYDADEYEDNNYLIQDSDTRYLEKSDLKFFTKEECRLARNEIYARHGRMFKDKDLQDYFKKQSWYEGTIAPDEFDEGVLNSIEKANAKLILKYEEKMK